jgi:hypothetical protein
VEKESGERVRPCCGKIFCGVFLGCDLVDVVQGRPVHYAKSKIPDWLYKYLDTIILNCRFVTLCAGFNASNGDFFPDFSLLLPEGRYHSFQKHIYIFSSQLSSVFFRFSVFFSVVFLQFFLPQPVYTMKFFPIYTL